MSSPEGSTADTSIVTGSPTFTGPVGPSMVAAGAVLVTVRAEGAVAQAELVQLGRGDGGGAPGGVVEVAVAIEVPGEEGIGTGGRGTGVEDEIVALGDRVRVAGGGGLDHVRDRPARLVVALG